MIYRRYFLSRVFSYRKYILSDGLNLKYVSNCNNYCAISSNFHNCITENKYRRSLIQCRFYSETLLSRDGSKVLKSCPEEDLIKIKQLFPEPRVVLHNLSMKTPEKIYEISYKPNVVAPKGNRKKSPKDLDWTCTYKFVWPDKMKFESTALSKRQAAEKAAVQALHYLYKNKRIDKKGNPMYDKNVINEMKSQLNEPFHIKVTDISMERVEKVWNDYENNIKPIYERTSEKAKSRMLMTPAALTKDSSIDEEDEFSDADASKNADEDAAEEQTLVHPVYGRLAHPASENVMQRRDKVLERKFQAYHDELTPLPIDQYIDQITSTIKNNPVTVIVGAAGCGKSTRVPAAILEHFGAKTAAVVSEPRRVAAIGLADRVACEMGETVGDSIGYQIRLQSTPPRAPCGAVLYCTSGVLLKRLQANPGLKGCTHIIIDEAHERDVNTDVTLLLLKRALALNKDLRAIIMSATLDTQVFTKYFQSCPVIEVPGRTFPVQVAYLDEIQTKYNLRLPLTMDICNKGDSRPYVISQEVLEVIKAVDKNEPEGAILVFLPGWADIKQVKLLLDQQYNDNTHLVLPVHSRLSTSDQTKMFTKPLPGVRKIVLATNVAETSITIPDVVYVVDTGAHKENRIKQGTGTASLETVWVSQAAAKQRTGRAGRVQPGLCYRMYTKEREAELIPHSVPEILRVPLVQTVLDCKSYAPDDKIESFLLQLPDPPSHKAIQFAVNDLIDLGALTPSEQLTPLGSYVSSMALPARLACCALHGAVCGAAVAATNVAAHAADNTQIFNEPSERREEIRNIKRKYCNTSDHSALHLIQEDYENALFQRTVNEYCEPKGLRKDRLAYVKSLSSLYLEQLLLSGFVPPTADVEVLNQYAGIEQLTAALLLSGANSLLRANRRVRTKGRLRTVTQMVTSTGEIAHIGSESVNYGRSKEVTDQLLTYFGGQHSSERRALVVYSTSVVTPHTALMFAKGRVDRTVVKDAKEDTTVITLPRHKLQVHMPTSHADIILKAREMLWNTFQYYMERDLKTMDYDEYTNVTKFKVNLVKAICRILVEADIVYVQKKELGIIRWDRH